jgi:hypothetical protein
MYGNQESFGGGSGGSPGRSARQTGVLSVGESSTTTGIFWMKRKGSTSLCAAPIKIMVLLLPQGRELMLAVLFVLPAA